MSENSIDSIVWNIGELKKGRTRKQALEMIKYGEIIREGRHIYVREGRKRPLHFLVCYRASEGLRLSYQGRIMAENVPDGQVVINLREVNFYECNIDWSFLE